MFKLLSTLLRAQAASATASLAARNAFTLLDQQIRDSAAALQQARRSLALAMAQDRQAAERIAALGQRIAVLEARARTALAAGREDLALEAAAAIAALEIDRDDDGAARQVFGAELAQLRDGVSASERRYLELHRGRRQAVITQAVLRTHAASPRTGALDEAETTLAALRARQATESATAAALAEISPGPARLEARLAEAGFGASLQPTATSVLARLRQRALPNA